MKSRRLVIGLLVGVPLLVAAGVSTLVSEPARGVDLAASRLVASEPLPSVAAENCTWEVAAPESGSQQPGPAPAQVASTDGAPWSGAGRATLDAATPPVSRAASVPPDASLEEILVPNCVAQPPIPTYAAATAVPTRAVDSQNALFNRLAEPVAHDAIHDEIVVPSKVGSAILTFRRDARGEDAPIRVIQGPKTGLGNPQQIFVDPVHDEIFVIDRTAKDEIVVFDRRAQGDVAPIRVLKGPDTRLDADFGAVDPVRNLIVVGGGNGLLIYGRTAQGNTKPLRVIAGPKSGVGRAGSLALYPPTGRIVANAGVEGEQGEGGFIGIWSIDDDGDVPPLWMFGGSNGGLTVDPKSKTIVASSKALNAVLSYSLPEMF